MIRVCLAGITGKVGRELFKAVRREKDIHLSSGVSRSQAGTVHDDVPVFVSVEEALRDVEVDVLVDYTSHSIVKENVLCAIERGVHVVIGASGLSEADYNDLAQAAEARGTGIVAAGNFSISAALLSRFAKEAAQFMKRWEILDYGSPTKADSPSGTARELAYVLRDDVESPAPHNAQPARGLELNGSQIHSLRLPGVYSGIEIQFGLPGERLILRHESTSVEPYVAGTIHAIRRVVSINGLARGV